MKIVETIGAQGDVLFRRVKSVPKDAREVKREAGDPIVCAHSETGHSHIIQSPDVRLFETNDPFTCYLRLEVPHADVVHLRPHDTHETLRLLGEAGGAVYQVRRQREHSPEGYRMVQD